MKKILFLLLLPCALCAQYRPDWHQYAAWTAIGASGALHGAREAYHAQPNVFERYGASKAGFWGSEAWKRNYYHNDP